MEYSKNTEIVYVLHTHGRKRVCNVKLALLVSLIHSKIVYDEKVDIIFDIFQHQMSNGDMEFNDVKSQKICVCMD